MKSRRKKGALTKAQKAKRSESLAQFKLSSEKFPILAEQERRYVQQVLDRCKGNFTHAAQILGIARSTIYRILDV